MAEKKPNKRARPPLPDKREATSENIKTDNHRPWSKSCPHCKRPWSGLDLSRRESFRFPWFAPEDPGKSSRFGICHACLTICFFYARSTDYNDEAYFTTDYQRQYGRTYLEDRQNIDRMNHSRLDFFTRTTGLNPGANSRFSVLELGAATGFFLAAWQNRFPKSELTGLEISGWCARHQVTAPGTVRQTDLLVGLEKEASASRDVVGAFFVLEHLPDQAEVLAAISRVLKPGGWFFSAWPSAYGPALRFSPKTWQQTHPADHFVDYSPISLSRVLPLYGFERPAFRVPSFHPHRWPFPWSRAGARRLTRLWAHYRRMGDTLECLAQKSP